MARAFAYLEALRLRVKDIDFASNEIMVRGGKGDRDRVTMLPERLKGPLLRHLAEVRRQHERDVAVGEGWVDLPGAYAGKSPNAGREWGWQWIFPASRTYTDWVRASDGTICTRRWYSACSKRPCAPRG